MLQKSEKIDINIIAESIETSNLATRQRSIKCKTYVSKIELGIQNSILNQI